MSRSPHTNVVTHELAPDGRTLTETAERTKREVAMSADEIQGSNLEKDPDDWKTGDEPMTAAQKSYLKTLSDEAKEPFDDDLTKGEASKRIDELQEKTGRGRS